MSEHLVDKNGNKYCIGDKYIYGDKEQTIAKIEGNLVWNTAGLYFNAERALREIIQRADGSDPRVKNVCPSELKPGDTITAEVLKGGKFTFTRTLPPEKPAHELYQQFNNLVQEQIKPWPPVKAVTDYAKRTGILWLTSGKASQEVTVSLDASEDAQAVAILTAVQDLIFETGATTCRGRSAP